MKYYTVFFKGVELGGCTAKNKKDAIYKMREAVFREPKLFGMGNFTAEKD